MSSECRGGVWPDDLCCSGLQCPNQVLATLGDSLQPTLSQAANDNSLARSRHANSKTRYGGEHGKLRAQICHSGEVQAAAKAKEPWESHVVSALSDLQAREPEIPRVTHRPRTAFTHIAFARVVIAGTGICRCAAPVNGAAAVVVAAAILAILLSCSSCELLFDHGQD